MQSIYMSCKSLRLSEPNLLSFLACYRKSYGLKGYGFGQGGPALLCSDLGERLVIISCSFDSFVAKLLRCRKWKMVAGN